MQVNLIDQIAERLELDSDQLLRSSLESFLRAQLRRVDAEIESLRVKYAVQSAKEIDARYSEGTLPEEGTWEDYFRLDHLEYRHRKLIEALDLVHESH
ncbi:MAG: hypothetical protein DCC52_06585 [Chloroflexi bacterium]|nr:MAG: hypothetical protein DCC52_06585 [Chloroflexota bacterium]